MKEVKSFKDIHTTRNMVVRSEVKRMCSLMERAALSGKPLRHPHKMIKRGLEAEVLADKDYQAVKWVTS